MKKRNVVLIHLLYWFYVINQSLFPVYVGKLDPSYMAGGLYWKDISFSLFLNFLSFYVVYFTFPRITALRKKIWIIFALVLLTGLITIVRLPIDWSFWKYFGQLPEKDLVFEWFWVWNHLRMVVITGIYSILIRYMINAFEAQKIRDELINQRQASELALLKLQVNPHFLFNTLNNIYSLVYQRSDEAPEAVMKFSSIMRYVLYETNAEKVLLDREIEYLKSYIELQKLRIRQADFVSLEIEGETGEITVAPMMLIPFVENAFKHGSKNHQPGIIIRLVAEKQMIRFSVANYIKKNQLQHEKEDSGLGLANIRRRLELIYPGKHNLKIIQNDDQFQAILFLFLQ